VTAVDALRSRLAAGGPVFGAWSTLGGPLPAEILARLGFDYVCVDLQHGLAGLESAAPALQGVAAAGSAPLARVPGNEPWLIMRLLDLGASGIIVPLVSTPEEAMRAAQACRYPPEGARSWGPVRTAGAPDATPAERNTAVLCVVMVETVEGVANLETICATPGVDAVYVGPSDLGLSHALPPGPELDTVIAGIAETCRRCGVPAGIHTRSGAAARVAIELGYSFTTIATDRDLLARAARAELAAALGREPESRPAVDADLVRAAASYTS
jgi:4-hydroxy-2-oxoheptanedioate aldolase